MYCHALARIYPTLSSWMLAAILSVSRQATRDSFVVFFFLVALNSLTYEPQNVLPYHSGVCCSWCLNSLMSVIRFVSLAKRQCFLDIPCRISIINLHTIAAWDYKASASSAWSEFLYQNRKADGFPAWTCGRWIVTCKNTLQAVQGGHGFWFLTLRTCRKAAYAVSHGHWRY